MNFVKYVLMLAMLAGFAVEASAQYTVRGKITDKAGEPLAGAGVTVRGLPGAGAVTGSDGNYVLEIPDNSNHTIVASFIGFMTQSRLVKPDGNNDGNISLDEIL